MAEDDTDSGCARLVMGKLQSVLARGVEHYVDTCDNLLLSKSTLLRASHDVIRMTSDRPCGLRGAVVDLFLDDGDCCRKLAQVVADPKVAPKTVLKLTLHSAEPTSSSSTLEVLPGYTLERSCLP
ncbi:DNA damage-inducible transcript 4 protein-like isoform X2 [Oratosquilla oratoria]|uniref:DNA damage-inducible transcript 4 protein-like isoform X2 n=1 Tax=Oratosquilla oratoria TaxID=337810 RepID=UPI003F76D80C